MFSNGANQGAEIRAANRKAEKRARQLELKCRELLRRGGDAGRTDDDLKRRAAEPERGTESTALPCRMCGCVWCYGSKRCEENRRLDELRRLRWMAKARR